MRLGLLYLDSSVAFSANSASCTILLNMSYALPVIVLLIRGRSALTEHQTEASLYSLGRWGLPINIIAAVFVVVTCVASLTVPNLGARTNAQPVLLLPDGLTC